MIIHLEAVVVRILYYFESGGAKGSHPIIKLARNTQQASIDKQQQSTAARVFESPCSDFLPGLGHSIGDDVVSLAPRMRARM